MGKKSEGEKEFILSGCDPEVVDFLVSCCNDTLRDYSTTYRMAVSCNLMLRSLRLFCVCGEKKDVMKLVKRIHKGLSEEVEYLFRD